MGRVTRSGPGSLEGCGVMECGAILIGVDAVVAVDALDGLEIERAVDGAQAGGLFSCCVRKVESSQYVYGVAKRVLL